MGLARAGNASAGASTLGSGTGGVRIGTLCFGAQRGAKLVLAASCGAFQNLCVFDTGVGDARAMCQGRD